MYYDDANVFDSIKINMLKSFINKEVIMKKMYYVVLTILTVALLIFMSFVKVNSFTNWVDFSSVKTLIDIVCGYGPMVMLCLFAFGGIVFSKTLFILVLILLVVFTVCNFAPLWIASIFGANGNSDAVLKLFMRM